MTQEYPEKVGEDVPGESSEVGRSAHRKEMGDAETVEYFRRQFEALQDPEFSNEDRVRMGTSWIERATKRLATLESPEEQERLRKIIESFRGSTIH